MISNKIRKTVSDNCLGGRPWPASLETLWGLKDDPFVSDTLMLDVLTALDVLEDGFSEKIANGDPEILANVHAHQRVFKRVGFFATRHQEDLLAFDFQSGPAEDPPVVELNTEGSYRWLGANLGEAIISVAEHRCTDEEVRDFPEGPHKIAGADAKGETTQFLPSIGNWHERICYELLGRPRKSLPSGAKPAEPHEPATWLLRPGDEVHKAITRLLKLPAGTIPAEQWVSCDGDGRVCTIWFHNTPETVDVPMHGVKFGMAKKKVLDLLGKPSDEDRFRFKIGHGTLSVSLENGKVDGMTLWAEDE